jgi:hypothetical protein
MSPKASFGNIFRSKLRGIIPSAARDCSTYRFLRVVDDLQVTALLELEFHNKVHAGSRNRHDLGSIVITLFVINIIERKEEEIW